MVKQITRPIEQAEPGRQNPVFELERVSFSHPGGIIALDEVSFNVQAGERVVILGANGSGKSTLLKLLDGLYFADSGKVMAFGELLTKEILNHEERAFAFRRRVGLVFQDPDVQLFSSTVWDEVAFAPLQLGLSQDEVTERAERAIRLLSLDKLRNRPPYRLSEGEKKKVCIASVLSLSPEVWLLDEPTASLDPRSESWLLSFIDQLGKEGKTVVVATQDLDIVEHIADRVLVFSEDHRLVFSGMPQEAFANLELLDQCNLVHFHRHLHDRGEHVHHHLHTHEHGH